MFKVWDINWPAVMLFLRCETQWRVAATMAGLIYLGIDYSSAEVVLNARSRSARRGRPALGLLDDLRVMETEASKAMNEARG